MKAVKEDISLSVASKVTKVQGSIGEMGDNIAGDMALARLIFPEGWTVDPQQFAAEFPITTPDFIAICST
jgi:hypothetical protein